LLIRGKGESHRKFHFDEEIVKVKGGIDHYMFLTKSGKLFMLGSNDHGQLGLDVCRPFSLWSSLPAASNDADEVYEDPQHLSSLDGVDLLGSSHDQNSRYIVDIAAGHYSSFAVTNDSGLFGWGAGILGTGQEYFDSRPQHIADGVIGVEGWRDVIISKMGNGEMRIFGATIESEVKILKPTICNVDRLPESTDEYPDMPVHYFSHTITTDPVRLSSFFQQAIRSCHTNKKNREYRNYNYAIFH
jgi:hypothetical protein